MGLLDFINGETSNPKEKKWTKSPVFLEVSNSRKNSLDNLVVSLDFGRRKFLFSNLNSYFGTSVKNKFWNKLSYKLSLRRFYERALEKPKDEKSLEFFRDAIYTESGRFSASKLANPDLQFKYLFEKAMSRDELIYLHSLLKKSLKDIYIPARISELFNKIYKVNIRRDYITESGVPRTPLLLVVGDSRMGKTETIASALEDSTFNNEIKIIEPDFSLRGRIKTLFRKSNYYRALKDATNRRAVLVELSRINPMTVKAKWYGQSARNFSSAFQPSPGMTSISIIEEAHGVFGEPNDNETIVSEQQNVNSTVATALDGVVAGNSNVITIAITHSPDKIAKEIFNRFVQHGIILDMNQDWNGKDGDIVVKNNLKQVVKLELMNPTKPSNRTIELPDGALDAIVSKISGVFEDRDLRVSPAYVRRLISVMVERYGNIKPEYFEDRLLVREGFKDVAKNAFGVEFYNNIVSRMQRQPWENYKGEIKDRFMDMAVSRLYYSSASKGTILEGPPGSGKTYLAQCFMSTQREVEDIVINPSIIYGGAERANLATALENIDKVFAISKMLAPSLLFIDEIDGLIPARKQGGPEDKIVNKFLNEIGGERSFRGVYIVGTTNRLDMVDPALVRALRLDVLSVDGNLSERNIANIIESELADYKIGNDEHDSLYKSVKKVCHTPSEIISLIKTVKETHQTESRVASQLIYLLTSNCNASNLEEFIKLNKLTVENILSDLGIPALGNSLERLIENKEHVADYLSRKLNMGYNLTNSHIKNSLDKFLQHPHRRGINAIDDFLAGEISKEPQVGFVMGMAASGDRGQLVPIASTLLYKTYKDKFVITGCVSPGENSPDLNAYVKMVEQSAKEAYSSCINYLSSIASKRGIDVSMVVGDYLDGWSIHHQFLNPQYIGGGPSAGYALVINTLSVILDIPVMNDFAITGAPWSRGPTRDETGSPIIIGGGTLKTYKALDFFTRMYVPDDNLKDIPKDYVKTICEAGKIVLPVENMRNIVPQVFYFNDRQKEKVSELINLKSKEVVSGITDKKRISSLEKEISTIAENEIIKRLEYISSKHKAQVAAYLG